MTVQLYSGQVLLNGGAPAVSSACCCTNCACDVVNPGPSYCTQCATSDFPSSFSGTPRGWQLDITGVTGGSASGCSSPACAFASDYAFFNRSFLFDPCDSATTDYECIYLCTAGDDGLGGTYYYFEWNYLQVAAGAVVSSSWTARAHLVAEIVRFSRAVGTDTSTICNSTMAANMAASSTNGGAGFGTVMSRAVADFTLARTMLTYQNYQYDTSTCDPASCTNPIVEPYGACYPAAWSLTPNSPTTSWQDSCHAANDVTGASVSAYSV